MSDIRPLQAPAVQPFARHLLTVAICGALYGVFA
jgi:hypothetical protein